ncbi:hypothetical protein GH714_043232 [Hevea brasiliensis]|uniref:Uncharacterized protein n=1 Tax=Hevea brasiliensis TaxID=3981 RepID=A0A6A6K2R6_HEVBR|nr:hypothetical protein GH714_043232 [Hevea brasiliensis]
MGKEEIQQITRRTTRSFSSSSATGNEAVKTKISESYIPTLKDLVFGGNHLSYDDLLSSFPTRGVQISQIVHLLGPLNSPMLPIFIYGGASTGKTSIILQIFRHLNRPLVYASYRTCYSPCLFFESILNQLLLHKKNAVNGYSSSKRCEKPSDFVNLLRESLLSVIGDLKVNSGKLSSNKLPGQPNGSMVYLILDNLELVRNWDKSSTILPFMFSLYDILKMPEVGLIYISNTSPDTYYSNVGYVEPIPVYFPEYTEEDLRQIFLRNQENRKLYLSFLEKYCEPLNDLEHVSYEEMKRRLFSHFQPHIALSLNEIFQVPSWPPLEVESNKEKKRKSSIRKSGGCEDFAELDFHMSTSAKYLLISAFLASRNPATLDASLFDSTAGSDSHKRKRKASVKSLEQKEAAEQELLMKGPGTFPLERLLAIFQCISSVVEGPLDEENENDVLRFESGDSGFMSDVLMQLSSLCNANFIIKGGSCPLEGSTRYRSMITEDMALKVVFLVSTLNFI